MSGHIYFEGDEFYDSLFSDLKSAQRSVFIEFYIFNYHPIGEKILSLLKWLADEKRVRVKLMVDGVGSNSQISTIADYLANSKVEFIVFKPVTIFSIFKSGIHRRNHRKLIIIDRKVCYLGGMNITEENSQLLYGEARWRDTMLRLERNDSNSSFFRFLRAGALVLFESVRMGLYPVSFTALLKLRNFTRLTTIPGFRRKLKRWQKRSRETEPKLFTTLFLRDRAYYRSEYFRLLMSAKEKLYLCAPYFVASPRVMRLLRKKAKQGIDVRVLTAGKTDVWSARQAGRSTYQYLLKSGVRIYEMQNRVFHAKQSLIDNTAMIGSGNLDYRSFWHNQELMVLCTDQTLESELIIQWAKDINESHEIHLSIFRRRGWFEKLTEKFFYGFRYYL